MNPLQPYHIAAIEYLRQHPVATVPRAMCHGAALRHLETLGLVQRSGIPGFWNVTEDGRAADLPALKIKPNTRHLPWEPEGEDRAALAKAYAAIDGLMPGGRLFGSTVRRADLDHLSGRRRGHKFVYFAYPLGYPLKHIAWAMRGDCPLMSDIGVCAVRHVHLKMPAMRNKKGADPVLDEERALRKVLLEQGMEGWEITEYFAVRRGGAVL